MAKKVILNFCSKGGRDPFEIFKIFFKFFKRTNDPDRLIKAVESDFTY